MKISRRVQTILPYLLGTILLIYITKPTILFKPNGKVRNYGMGVDEEGYKKTLYTFQFVIIILIIIFFKIIK